MTTRTVLHLALPEDWRAARVEGHYRASTRGATIADEGFLHASRDADQARRVADFFYRDRPDVVVLEMDVEALAAHGLEVRMEPGDPTTRSPSSSRTCTAGRSPSG